MYWNIKIGNDLDKKKFINKLFLYRSFLFKFIKFKTNSKDTEIKSIITALNIKSRRKRISYIYDSAIKYIDNHYKDKDMCRFIDDRCIMHRTNKLDYMFGCCRMCEYKNNKGCPTRNIACKLFYCSKVKENINYLKFSDINILKVLSSSQQYILKNDYFSLEKDVVNDMFYGIFIVVFRIFGRFLKYFIKEKRRFMYEKRKDI